MPRAVNWRRLLQTLLVLAVVCWLILVGISHRWDSSPAPLLHQYPLLLQGFGSDAPSANRDLVLFLHIPKSAGQSFRSLLGSTIGKNPRRHDPAFVSPECAALPLCLAASDRLGYRLDMNFLGDKQHAQLDLAGIAQYYKSYDVVAGHLDASVELAFPRRRVVAISVLRHPWQRFLSFYRFLNGNARLLHHCTQARLTGEFDSGLMVVQLNLYKKTLRAGAPIQRSMFSMLAEDHPFYACRRVVKKVTRMSSLQELEAALDAEYQGALNGSQPLSHLSLPLNVSMQQFAEDLVHLRLANYVTQALSGFSSSSFHDRTLVAKLREGLHAPPVDLEHRPPEIYVRARQRLDSLAFVGLVERWPETVELFVRSFEPMNVDWSDPKQLERFVGSHRNPSLEGELAYAPPAPQPSEEELAAIQARVLEIEWLDLALYGRGERIFEHRYQQLVQPAVSVQPRVAVH